MSQEVLQLLKMAHTGDGASEVIKLKLVPLENLWREAPDAKALSALYLYIKFQELKVLNEKGIFVINSRETRFRREARLPYKKRNSVRFRVLGNASATSSLFFIYIIFKIILM
jgi:hypothetical protein